MKRGIFNAKYLKCQRPPVHIQDHVEGVGNFQLLVDVSGIWHTAPVLSAVVVNLE